MPCLISNGGHVLEFRELPSRFGTSPENEIVVQEGLGVKGHHFSICREADHIVLESTGQGATTVNGHDVRRTSIHDGDRIQVGQLMLIYSCDTRDSAGIEGWKTASAASPAEELPGALSPIRSPALPGENKNGNARSYPEEMEQIPAVRNRAVSDALSGFAGTTDNPFEAATVPAGAAELVAAGHEIATEAESELAKVFENPEPDQIIQALRQAVEPIDVEIPALPDISEAKDSGALVSTELPSREIKPKGLFGGQRPKPLPPGRHVSDEREEEERATAVEQDAELPSNRKLFRRGVEDSARQDDDRPTPRGTGEGVADRLATRSTATQYQRLIPWHKVGMLVCLVFAGAGAYLATHGQHHVEDFLAKFGFVTESHHASHMRRLASLEPALVITLNAEHAVSIYKRWAVGEDWMSLGELDALIAEYAEGFNLSDLERVTFSMDAAGRGLALISTKTELERRLLIRELGRGLLSLERVGEIAVHEGFVGRRTGVKFALLNPKTIVIGDPELTLKFLSAPVTQAAGDAIDQPVHALANERLDWLGAYFSKTGLARLRTSLPNAVAPAVNRMLKLVESRSATESKLLARLGVDVRLDSTFLFDSSTIASEFASGWAEMAEDRLQDLMAQLGPHGKSLLGAQMDLSNCRITAAGNRATLELSVANRWTTLEPATIKNTFLSLVDVFRKQPTQAPSLISPEEQEARETAHQIVQKYEQGLKAGAKGLEGLTDLETIVRKLAVGVRGSGAYRNVTYRVPGASNRIPRVLELLEWGAGGRVTVNTVRKSVPQGSEGKALVTEGRPQDDVR